MITDQPVLTKTALRTLGFIRLGLGWIFLWAFIDKVFGFGFATLAGQGWIDGVSPTTEFLKFATAGPLRDLYSSLAGVAGVDWLFMIGLVAIGLSLLTGIGLKIAGWAGAVMMVLFWSAAIPPAHNPLVDEHIVYFFIFGVIAAQPELFARVSLRPWWAQRGIVRHYPFLQ